MEVLSRKSVHSPGVLVVRQFLPSRIEQQVLAQVFELVCGPQTVVGGRTSSLRGDAVAAHGVIASAQRSENLDAGRRAA
jgi:hypothetical protein